MTPRTHLRDVVEAPTAPPAAATDEGQPVDSLLDEVLRVLRDGTAEGLPGEASAYVEKGYDTIAV